MANNLTGDYDAVLQISIRQINSLLATLHQNGASDDPPLKLAHSAILRVGDPHEDPDIERLHDFRDWVRNFQIAGASGGLGKLRKRLSAGAPPGAAKLIEGAFSTFGKIV